MIWIILFTLIDGYDIMISLGIILMNNEELLQKNMEKGVKKSENVYKIKCVY